MNVGIKNRKVVGAKSKTNKKLPPKIYNYALKKIGAIKFDDLVNYLGIDGACKILKYFSGSYLYIPKISTIKKDFIHAIIRADAKQLKEEMRIGKVVESLSAKYSMHESTISKIIGYKNNDANLSKTKFKKRIQINEVRDENLLALLKKYYNKIKEEGLI